MKSASSPTYINTGLEQLDKAIQKVLQLDPLDTKQKVDKLLTESAELEIVLQEFPLELLRLGYDYGNGFIDSLLGDAAVDEESKKSILAGKEIASIIGRLTEIPSVYEYVTSFYKAKTELYQTIDKVVNSVVWQSSWSVLSYKLQPKVRITLMDRADVPLLTSVVEWSDLSFLFSGLISVLEKDSTNALKFGELDIFHSEFGSECLSILKDIERSIQSLGDARENLLALSQLKKEVK